MQNGIIDSKDLEILNLLARNGRSSYRSVARNLGMTTKTVKSRVDKMNTAKVFERFITLVNPSILGYGMICNFSLRKDMLTKEIIDRINLVGDIHYQYHVMGGVEGFIMLVPEGSEEKSELLLKSLQPAILGVTIQNCGHKEFAEKLSATDYRLIKQLIYNPRMQISELGKSISATSKTVRRRLDSINDRLHILEFTILPNPKAMKGQIIFFLLIKVKRPLYNMVLETVFSQLCNHIIFSLITYDQEKETIGLNLATEDVFKIETIRSEIQYLEGVKEVNIFFPIKVQYHEETVVKAINRQIMSKSINA